MTRIDPTKPIRRVGGRRTFSTVRTFAAILVRNDVTETELIVDSETGKTYLPAASNGEIVENFISPRPANPGTMLYNVAPGNPDDQRFYVGKTSDGSVVVEDHKGSIYRQRSITPTIYVHEDGAPVSEYR